MRRIGMGGLLLAALFLAACTEEPTGSIISARYSATVDGVVKATIQGRAIFGEASDEIGSPVFVVVLGEDTSRYALAFTRPGTTRPGKGTYDFTDVNTGGDPWKAVFVVSDGGGEPTGLFVASQGRLRITHSTPEQLRGTFEFAALGYLHEDAATSVRVDVKGSFDAALATAGGSLAPRTRRSS